MSVPTDVRSGPLHASIPLYDRRRELVGYATVDDDPALLTLLTPHRWFDAGGYAATRLPAPLKSLRYLHQMVWKHYHGSLPPAPLVIDHRDRGKRNNTRGNLRAADQSTQAANKGRRRDNRSGYKGVCDRTYRTGGRVYRRWLATVRLRGRFVLSRLFPRTPEGLLQAARAVNDAYRRFYPHVDIPNPCAESSPLSARVSEWGSVSEHEARASAPPGSDDPALLTDASYRVRWRDRSQPCEMTT